MTKTETPVVDQRRAANRRRIARTGGVVAGNEDPMASEPAIYESRVIRDSTGTIMRIL